MSTHTNQRNIIRGAHKQRSSTTFSKELKQTINWLNPIHLNPRGFVATHWVEEYVFFPQGFLLRIRLVTLVWNSLKYLIRTNFRAYKFSRIFAQKLKNARKLVQILCAKKQCAKINTREMKKNQIFRC